MYQGWTAHLKSAKDKEEFEQTVARSREVLSFLVERLDKEEKALSQSELDVTSFDSPSWAYKQAYKNGYRKALTNLKTFIDLDKQVIKEKKL